MYSNCDKKFKQKGMWLELLHQRPNPPLSPPYHEHIKDMDCWLRQSFLICLFNLFKVVIDVSFLLAGSQLISRSHLHSANMTYYFLCIFHLLMMIWSSGDTSVRDYFCNLSSNILNSISRISFQRLLICICTVFGLYCSGTTTTEEGVFILVHKNK